MVVKFFVVVKVKVGDEGTEVVRLEFSVAILANELTNLLLVEQAFILSVHASKRCEWLKVTHMAQLLPCPLDIGLTFRGES